MARSAAGVVRVAAIPILAWLFQDCLNNLAAACGCSYPSLPKEGSLLPSFATVMPALKGRPKLRWPRCGCKKAQAPERH